MRQLLHFQTTYSAFRTSAITLDSVYINNLTKGSAMDWRVSRVPASQQAIIPRIRSERLAALLIAAVGVGVALAARIAWPFDGLYGQDAFAYFHYARALWPWLLRGEPLPVYYWPAGYPLLVALVLPLVSWSSLGGQAVSIASGAAAASLTYLLSRTLLPDAPGGRTAAWVGGLAVALSGAVLRANLVVMSDALAMACCVAASWALVRYVRTRRWPFLAGAAVALAWAIITRWICGLLALPMLGFLILEIRHPTEPPEIARRRRIGHFVVATVLGALIVIPQLLDRDTTPVELTQHQWVVGWNIANAWQRDFTTVDGTQHYALPVGIFYLAQLAWPSFLFPLLALACPFGTLWLVRGRRWPALALLAGWPLIVWLFVSGIPYQNSRFILPALPALAVLAGLGFAWAYATARRWLRMALAVALAASLLGGLAWGVRDYRKLVAYENDQLALVDWVRARLPASSILITFGATLTLQHYTTYDVRELFELAPPDLDTLARQQRPVYLLLDVGSTERQWAGLRPQQDYHYLQQHPGLDVIDQRLPYVLFRVKPPG
jgi:4-amino-4-deoxy-L-arabinose transferase-like glycosyltransferase